MIMRNIVIIALGMFCVLCGQDGVIAQQVKLDRNATSVLDKRLSQQYKGSGRLQPSSARVPDFPAELVYGSSRMSPQADKSRYQTAARNMARRHGIPESLFFRLIDQESRWNPKAKSHKGALGLTQLMPATAKYLGVNPHNPVENLEGGARYLSEQYKKFRSWRLALAAYNAGPKAVERYGGVPPYRETQNYVKKILKTGR